MKKKIFPKHRAIYETYGATVLVTILGVSRAAVSIYASTHGWKKPDINVAKNNLAELVKEKFEV